MKKLPWKYILLGFGFFIIVPILISSFQSNYDQSETSQIVETTASNNSATINKLVEETTPIDSPEEQTNKQLSREKTTVTNVIDGDTIEISGGLKVRYIGMDTPETSGTVDCYVQKLRTETRNL